MGLLHTHAGDLETYRVQHARMLGFLGELGFSKSDFLKAPYEDYAMEGTCA